MDLRLNRTVFHPGWVPTARVSSQDEFASRITDDVNSASVSLKEYSVKTLSNLDQTDDMSAGAQSKVGRRGRRRRNRKHRKQQETPQ